MNIFSKSLKQSRAATIVRYDFQYKVTPEERRLFHKHSSWMLDRGGVNEYDIACSFIMSRMDLFGEELQQLRREKGYTEALLKLIDLDVERGLCFWVTSIQRLLPSCLNREAVGRYLIPYVYLAHGRLPPLPEEREAA
jgi:hypothetical protein